MFDIKCPERHAESTGFTSATHRLMPVAPMPAIEDALRKWTNFPASTWIDVIDAFDRAQYVPAQGTAVISSHDSARILVTLNGAQICALLDAVGGGQGEEAETEVTIIAHDKPFTSLDDNEMAAGLYFYWTDYPEEGIIRLFDIPVA